MQSNAIPRRFLVLTTQRTGSSWLMDRIDSVPGAQGHRELFLQQVRSEPSKGGRTDYPRFVEIGSRFGRGKRPGSVFAYLDRLYSRPGAVGFKLMYSQLREFPEILYYIVRRRLTVIHLVRNNHLDVFLSERLGRQTGRFHATVDEGFKQTAVVTLDPGMVAAVVQRLDRKQRVMRTLLKFLPVPVYEVAYESLCRGNATFLELCDFLGVPGEREDRAHVKLVKTQRAPHSEVISNYQEVRTALALAGYQHLLQ